MTHQISKLAVLLPDLKKALEKVNAGGGEEPVEKVGRVLLKRKK